MANSYVDSETAFYTAHLVPLGSLQDRRFAYWSGLSGLTPVAKFSVTDHKKVYLETQTGLTDTNSIADIEMAYLTAQLAVGSTLNDKWKNWFETH